MTYSLSSRAAARLLALDETGSTNDELVAHIARESAADWPEFSVIASTTQTSGRGRLGRAWVAPPGTMLATSVLLRPRAAGIRDAVSLGWLPLIAGLAMTRALRELGADAVLKWPNDVLVGERKICGVLCEASDGVVIVGTGINLTLTPEQLPVPTATSMSIVGAETDADRVLSTYLAQLRTLYGRFCEAGGDPGASEIKEAVEGVCSTLGRAVRVELPAGHDLVGTAEGIDDSGRLLVSAQGRVTAVSAGDITHLRY